MLFSLLAIVFSAVLFFIFRKIILSRTDIDLQNQIEFDKYVNAKLSSVEIGLFYERYIGYLFEIDGYDVYYHGAIKGYDDLGRDLIVKKGKEIWIIQTKCWAKSKQIQAKHIFQLYGTLEHYKRFKNKKNAKAAFFTTSSYSREAEEAADLLGIDLRIEKLNRSYPMIKCNVSNRTGEKIYHLPLDEFYDKIKIEIHKGEFFAKTVKEATAKGFRRARKYRKTG